MWLRALPIFSAALAVALSAGGPAPAADKPTRIEGMVVEAAGGKLVVTGKTANRIEYTFTVTKDTKITCDGAVCKLEDLKRGYGVKVTAEKQKDKNVATKVEAKKK